jgi:hypothetical protein
MEPSVFLTSSRRCGEDRAVIYTRSKDILMEQFENGLLVLNLVNHLSYGLNAMAADILMNTDGLMSTETIAGKICLKYDVGFQEALEDIDALYRDFDRKGIVERVK